MINIWYTVCLGFISFLEKFSCNGLQGNIIQGSMEAIDAQIEGTDSSLNRETMKLQLSFVPSDQTYLLFNKFSQIQMMEKKLGED